MVLAAPEMGDLELLRNWSKFAIAEQELDSSTVTQYSRILMAFLYDSTVKFADVTEEIILRWLGNGPSGTWGKESRSRALRLFYAWAVRNGHLSDDPTLDLVIGKKKPGGSRDIEKADIEKILVAAREMEDPRVAPTLELLYFTGVRAAALVGAHSEDVDLATGHIFWRTPRRGVTYTSPLNGRALEAAKTLVRLIDYHPTTASRLPTLVGVGEERVRQWLKAACDRAQVKRVAPNQFRYSFGSASIVSDPQLATQATDELRARLHAAVERLNLTQMKLGSD